MTRQSLLCRTCGEFEADHTTPCNPAECCSARCHRPMVDTALGLCRAHLDVVAAQRGRPASIGQLRTRSRL